MKITVLLKFYRGELNPFDAAALECALSLGAEVTALTMAPPSALPSLEGLTRLGVRAVMLSDSAYAGSDTIATSYILARALERMEYDLLFCGRQSVDGDTAQVPPMLAQRLNLPIFRSVVSITKESVTTKDGVEHPLSVKGIYTFEKIKALRFPSIFSKKGNVEMLTNAELALPAEMIGPRGSPTRVVRSYESTVGRRECKFITKEELPSVFKNALCKADEREAAELPSEEKAPLVYFVGNIEDAALRFAHSAVRLDIKSAEELAEEISALGSAIVLFEGRRDIAELAARCAVLLGAGLCADCISFRYTNGRFIMTRPALGGDITADIECKSNFAFATVRAPDRSGARALLCVGRGAEGRIGEVRELASLLSAEAVASRPVVDGGKMPYSAQVGQTGRTVSPAVYLALGLSGAVQHTSAISESGTVIAVNTDRTARIFDYADFGLVADVGEITEYMKNNLK